MSRKDDNSLTSILIKAVARLIAGLIVIGITMFFEFVLNLEGNTSFYLLANHSATALGVNCSSDPVFWRFQAINETGTSNKKDWIKMSVWMDRDGVKYNEYITTLTEGSQFQLAGCESQPIDVARVWDVNRSDLTIHFRVHPTFRMIDHTIPHSLGGLLRHILNVINLNMLLTSAIVGILILGPLFFCLFFFDLIDKIIDRYVFKKFDIPIKGHLLIAVAIGIVFFIFWPYIVQLGSQLNAPHVSDWFEQYIPKATNPGFINIPWSVWAAITAALGYLGEIGLNKAIVKITSMRKISK